MKAQPLRATVALLALAAGLAWVLGGWAAGCGATAAAGRDASADTGATDASAETGATDASADTGATDASADASGGPDTASPSTCGDGLLDPGEACDDGGTEPGGPGDWCAADCGALVDASSYQPFAGHRSQTVWPTSNGLTVAAFAEAGGGGLSNRLVAWRDHAYTAYDEATPSRDYLWDLYFGYRAGGSSSEATWLSSAPAVDVGYVPGTGILRWEQDAGGLHFRSYAFTPFHAPSPQGGGEAGTGDTDERVLVVVTRVEPTTEPVSDAAVFSLINVHAGGEGHPEGEAVELDPAGRWATERSSGPAFAYRSLGPPGGLATAGSPGTSGNPWWRVAHGEHFQGAAPSGPADDVAVGFEDPVGAWAPGEERWFGVAALMGRGADPAAALATLDAFVSGRGAQQILADELAWWDAFHASDVVPPGLSEQAAGVYAQSLAVLKMGQVRESGAAACPSGRCAGQILASLYPGQWNIAWVRDAAYAVAGLVRAGHLQEARAALSFLMDAETVQAGGHNYYQTTFIESVDPSPGIWGLGVALSADYAISVTRYWGRGLEESDSTAAGPNIEWDNWGLFLWALARYVEASGDDPLLAGRWPLVSQRVADLLVELVEPATGLLPPDSSIWERHWCPHGACPEPDTRKRFTYSQVTAARGLAAAAALAQRVGDEGRAVTYSAAAAALREAIRAQLVVAQGPGGGPALAGNVEELAYAPYYLDLAAIEAVDAGVVDAGERLAFGTVAAFDAKLAAGPHSPGYRRNDDPTWYDNQEWVVVDLRLVVALARMGQWARARTIFDWLTSQAHANAGLLPELLSDGVYQPGSDDDRWQPGVDTGGDYQGAVPMTGFGPGAYILAAWALAGG